MKKIIFLTMAILISLLSQAQQQGKKPTIMIVPSDNWCTLRFYTKNFDNQGSKVVVYDYERAFREDLELGGVVSKIGEILTNKGYSLKDCAQEIKAINDRHVEDMATTSKSGAELVESPLDILKRHSKADIIVHIDWKVIPEKKGNALNFTIEAFDSYTNKRIATSTGLGKPSKEVLPRMIEQALIAHIDAFDEQMDKFYKDIQKNGREIRMTVRIWDSCDFDLEEEFNGEELLDVIQNWMSNNTVNGVFNLSEATENRANFEQVRIPFINANGKAMDARSFGTDLRKYLAKDPYMITAKVMTRGLGEVILVIGEK